MGLAQLHLHNLVKTARKITKYKNFRNPWCKYLRWKLKLLSRKNFAAMPGKISLHFWKEISKAYFCVIFLSVHFFIHNYKMCNQKTLDLTNILKECDRVEIVNWNATHARIWYIATNSIVNVHHTNSLLVTHVNFPTLRVDSGGIFNNLSIFTGEVLPCMYSIFRSINALGIN